MSRKGIRNDDTVVLYGGNNNWFAAYAYWYFKVYGRASVKLLDGGRKKWELDGRSLTTDVVERRATTYTAQDQDLSIRAFRDEVIGGIGTKNLLDICSPDEFAGRLLAPAHLPQEQSQRPGHIPGASNVSWSRTTNDDGTFKTDEEIDTIYREASLDWSKDSIAYCRIGERSSHKWFAIHELLGHENIKNYDGRNTDHWSAYRSNSESEQTQLSVEARSRQRPADTGTRPRRCGWSLCSSLLLGSSGASGGVVMGPAGAPSTGMLARVHSQTDVDVIIIYQLSRMARNRYDDAIVMADLRKRGVALVSATEAIDDTPVGQLMHGILATFNEYQSRQSGADIA